jgi:DNA-directed RNA polymerase specialized sigma24 family protein
MKGCHSCKFKQAVDAGEFKNTPWEEVPCSSCDVMTGVGFAVEYDDSRESGDHAVEPPAHCMARGGQEKMLPVSVMSQVVTGLMTLKPELRDVVSLRYLGLTYPEIAERQGVTMACVEKRHRRAMELWPALREMFPEKVAKKRRRKPHSKRGEPQKAQNAQKNGEKAVK